MNCKQLTFAREFRGLTQTELASRVTGLSQSNLSKYEKGIGELSYAVLEKTMKELNFPMSFLEQKITNQVESCHYRKKASLKRGQRGEIDRFIAVTSYVFDELISNFEVPEYSIGNIEVTGVDTPAHIAQFVRKKLRLGNDPIDALCNIIERCGVFIYEWNCSYSDFDGVSLVTDAGNRLIIINQNMSNDRKRRTLAHEFGHTIMHNCIDFYIDEARNIEKEADMFASEFLTPSSGIKDSLFNLTMKALPLLKKRWKVSMQSIAYRAKELYAIDANRYTYLMTEFSRLGYRKSEPYPVDFDGGTMLRDIKDMTIQELGYSIDDISRITHLPVDAVASVLNMRPKVLKVSFKHAVV